MARFCYTYSRANFTLIRIAPIKSWVAAGCNLIFHAMEEKVKFWIYAPMFSGGAMGSDRFLLELSVQQKRFSTIFAHTRRTVGAPIFHDMIYHLKMFGALEP